jgi:hypothetical protein
MRKKVKIILDKKTFHLQGLFLAKISPTIKLGNIYTVGQIILN